MSDYHAKTPLDAWKCLFSDDIIKIIVDNTNIKLISAQAIVAEFSKSYMYATSIEEIYAFFGLTYVRGMMGLNHLNANFFLKGGDLIN